jgi:hypothetical protein
MANAVFVTTLEVFIHALRGVHKFIVNYIVIWAYEPFIIDYDYNPNSIFTIQINVCRW